MFVQTLTQVTKLFLFMLAGYVLTKKKIMPRESPKCLSMLLVWVCSPALYLNTFASQFTVAALTESFTLLLIAVIVLGLSCLIAFALKKTVSKEKYSQDVFTYSVCVPNFGYFGNVLVLALMGEASLLKYQIFVIPVTVYMLTKGYSMLLERKATVKGLLNPMMVAMSAGMIIGLLGIKVPQFILSALSGASDCMGPISMILSGCVIAGFDLKEVLGQKQVYLTVAIKMVLMPMLVVIAGKFINIPTEYLYLVLLFQAVPAGLNSIVYPSTIGKDCSFGAGLAVVSNVAALITIPVFVAMIG